MAALTATSLTLLDVANREDPSGKTAQIVELLAQENEVLSFASATECNDGTQHKTTVQTGLPAGAWRKLNYGVPNEKMTTAQVKDTCGMLESYSKVDKAIIDMARDPAGTRMSEDMGFLSGMSKTLASTMIYGDTDVNPERFLGFAPRFDVKVGAESGDNVILGGGAGADNTSVWLIGWGDRGSQLLYPKGSKAGITQRDLGEDTASDGNGGEYQILRTHFKADMGLCTRDWRKVVRIANVSVGALTKNAATGADLIDLMTQALELIPNGPERYTFLVSRTVRSFLRRQINAKVVNQLSLEDFAGKRVVAFDGFPVLRTDAILNTEATIA